MFNDDNFYLILIKNQNKLVFYVIILNFCHYHHFTHSYTIVIAYIDYYYETREKSDDLQ